MTGKKTFIKFLCLLLSIYSLSANEFEGSLTMVKRSYYDTTIYIFTVKGNMVRLDLKNAAKQTIQSLIIDLNTPKIIALSPNLKLYTYINLIKGTIKQSDDFKVTVTENNKMIQGYKCYQWRVRNESLNTEVSFWINKSDITFYEKTVTLLCNTDEYKNIGDYFMQISPKPGFLPILTEERTLLREEKSKTTITNITRKTINSNVFQVPQDYKFLRY